ncbi:MAG: DUF2141 domain-containing protein [Chitinophagaceae bacterium]
MKYLLLTALLALQSFHETFPTQTLVISNLDKVKGQLYIGWYNSAPAFPDAGRSVYHKIVQVENKESVEVPFENIPPGIYAIAVFLDKNGNGKIDKNILGIPKEKYGFSNNKYPLTRAATFNEAAFTIGEKELLISIRLKG